MPVSVITDVITWIELITQIGVTTVELGVLSYLVFDNGWLDMIRLISYWLDKTLIKYIDQFYAYFEKILAGELFSPTIVDNVMKNVYVFVSLLVLLKLLLLFMKYLANPEMVSDDRIGAQALVKRVILGMCGMLALPTIFNFSIDLQKAILNDNLFGKLLLDRNQLREYENNKDQMGRMLAFNVYQAFWNLDKSRVTSSKFQKEYDNALSLYDPGVIGSINEKFGEDYAYDYFPIASTVVLLYVIYLVIKYCIDVVVRMFKLFLLQMLGPLALSDYMVNGDSKDVFKNWVKTTLSVYAMLFVRIFSIWFIAFVIILMKGECTHLEKHPDTGEPTEVCADESLLYIKPGEEPDYLLKGIVTLGLLALLMDLPKFLSDILGLDLEQDATVKGLMQKVGGAAKGVAMGGLAVGGAAIGGAIGTAKALGGTVSKATGFDKAMEASRKKRNDTIKDKMGKTQLGSSLLKGADAFSSAANENNLGQHMGKAKKGVIAAAMNSNPITKTAYGAAHEQTEAHKDIDSKSSQQAEEARRHQEIVNKQDQQIQNQEFAGVMNITSRMADSGMPVTVGEVAARVRPTEVATVNANVQGQISSIAASSISASDVESGGKLSSSAEETVRRNVEEVVTRTYESQGVDTSLPAVHQQITQQVDQVMGSAVASVDTTGTVTLSVDTSAISAAAVGLGDQTITQVVNQVQGTSVTGSIADAVQTVNQTLGQVVDNTGETANGITQTVKIQREIQDSVEQQVNISREINDEVKVINTTVGDGLSANATINRKILQEAYEANDKDIHGNPKN